jgi:hypothetical protein
MTLCLDAPLAYRLHHWMISQGGTHGYPEYIPHTSINYTGPKQTIPHELPKFPLLFDRLSVMPIDPDYVRKNTINEDVDFFTKYGWKDL